MTSQYKVENVNPYLIPHQLTRCTYYLIVYGKIRRWLITTTTNREAVIVDFIKRAYEIKEQFWIVENMEFRITVKENGVLSTLIDSTIDKDFIKFLYDK